MGKPRFYGHLRTSADICMLVGDIRGCRTITVGNFIKQSGDARDKHLLDAFLSVLQKLNAVLLSPNDSQGRPTSGGLCFSSTLSRISIGLCPARRTSPSKSSPQAESSLTRRSRGSYCAGYACNSRPLRRPTHRCGELHFSRPRTKAKAPLGGWGLTGVRLLTTRTSHDTTEPDAKLLSAGLALGPRRALRVH